MQIDLNAPHDSFFRTFLSHLSVAKSLLKAHLPDHLSNRILWSTLRLSKSSFIREESFKHLHSDLVYCCKLKGGATLYIVIEHQSTPDSQLAPRVYQYSTALMFEHLHQGNERLPLVVSCCVYAGQQSPYPHSVSLCDCFEDAQLAARLYGGFGAGFLSLLDATLLSEKELPAYGQSDLLLLLLKQGQRGEFLSWLRSNPSFVAKLLERSYSHVGILYILASDRTNSVEELLEAIALAAPAKREMIMSAAQRLVDRAMSQGIERGIEQGIERGIEQGIERGIEQGFERGRLDVARNMLEQLGLEMDVVKRVTNLSEEQILELQPH